MPQQNLLKIVLFGIANVGKTSIARYITSLSPNYAADTNPSTYVERFKTQSYGLRINIFTTPGQKRFYEKNWEYLLNILSENIIILYVFDCSDSSRIKDMIAHFRAFTNKIIEYKAQTNIKNLTIAVLAHKQDLPKTIKGSELKQLISEQLEQLKNNGIKVYLYETSIYQPATLMTLFYELIYPRFLPVDKLQKTLKAMHTHLQASASVISDENGFPLALAGNENVASWLAILIAKLTDIITKEQIILAQYQSKLNELLFNGASKLELYSKLKTSSSLIVLYNLNQSNKPPLYLGVFDPKIREDVLEVLLAQLAPKLIRILEIRVGDYW